MDLSKQSPSPDALEDRARAGRRVYGEARRRQYAFVRKNCWHLALIVALCLFPNLGSFFVESAFLEGAVLGATLAAAFGLPAWLTVLRTGTAAIMMGAEAEQWTADEAARLTAFGFRVVHHAALGRGDVDHVLLGPAGAFVVETKWRTGKWDDAMAASASAQAAAKAKELWLLAKRFGVDRVTPVVAVWGAAAEAVSAPPLSTLPAIGEDPAPTPDSVVVLRGEALGHWLLSLRPDALSASEIDRVHREVAEHARRRDAVEEAAPLSLTELAGAVLRPVLGVYLALLLAAVLSVQFRAVDVALLAACILVALTARRSERWRGAGTCAGITLVLLLLLEAAQSLG